MNEEGIYWTVMYIDHDGVARNGGTWTEEYLTLALVHAGIRTRYAQERGEEVAIHADPNPNRAHYPLIVHRPGQDMIASALVWVRRDS